MSAYWRLDIEALTQRLEGEIRQRFAGESVAVVAHSMGGLVARALIARRPPAASGDPLIERLVMLGTPNRGSFEVPLILAGIQDPVRKLTYLAFPGTVIRHGADAARKKLLEIVNTFPSVYQMLPAEGTGAAELYAAGTYQRVNPGVSASHLAGVKAFQQQLQDRAVDPVRMVYVAGYGKPTVVGVKDTTKLGDYDAYEVSTAGDGKGPHALGLLPGVTVFYAPVEHPERNRFEWNERRCVSWSRGGPAPPWLPASAGPIPGHRPAP